uniref:Proteinase inhibitor I42 chagasin domain-containing protein n=1 Tax=Desulfacinum infernum TaxID=35837 RepID=A0A832A6C5_9BACT
MAKGYNGAVGTSDVLSVQRCEGVPHRLECHADGMGGQGAQPLPHFMAVHPLLISERTKLKTMAFRMLMLWLIFFTLLCLLFVRLGAAVVQGRDEVGEIVIGPGDNRRHIRMEGWPALIVRLESNPSTGYCWEVVDVDARLLRVISDKWIPRTELLGAGWIQEIPFASLRAGRTPARLVYRRVWEDHRAALGSFQFMVEAWVSGGVDHFADPPLGDGETLEFRQDLAMPLEQGPAWESSE